MTWCKSQ